MNIGALPAGTEKVLKVPNFYFFEGGLIWEKGESSKSCKPIRHFQLQYDCQETKICIVIYIITMTLRKLSLSSDSESKVNKPITAVAHITRPSGCSLVVNPLVA